MVIVWGLKDMFIPLARFPMQPAHLPCPRNNLYQHAPIWISSRPVCYNGAALISAVRCRHGVGRGLFPQDENKKKRGDLHLYEFYGWRDHKTHMETGGKKCQRRRPK